MFETCTKGKRDGDENRFAIHFLEGRFAENGFFAEAESIRTNQPTKSGGDMWISRPDNQKSNLVPSDSM